MFRQYTFHLTFPIVAMSGTLFMGAVATGWYVHWLQQDVSRLLSRTVAGMRAAEELEIRTREMRTRLNQFLVSGDPQYLHGVSEMGEQIEHWQTKAEDLADNPDERESTAGFRAGLDEFKKDFADVIQAHHAQAATTELKRMVARLIDDRITTGLLIPADAYLDFNQQSIQRTIPVNQQAADRVGLGMAALGFLGSVAGVVFGTSLARQFSASFVKLTVPVHDAAGMLNEVVGPIELSTPTGNMEDLNLALEALAVKVSDVVQQLQRSQRETLRAEQLAAVGQLAAGMAHELRNPLTAIKMIVQSAVEDKHNGSVSGEALHVLYDQILRQERSITGFLEFARPPRLEPHLFDLRDALQAGIVLLAKQGQRQGVAMTCTCPSDAVPILGDAVQMKQVIVNLLINAIEVLPHGGMIHAEIVTARPDEWSPDWPVHPPAGAAANAPWAILTIADDGPGLPDNLGNGIFEPFISTKETGMGLGLSISKRIVELHGGQIAARPRAAGGASFYVGLPLSEAQAVETAPILR